MFDVLDRQMTGNQEKIIAAAIIGDALLALIVGSGNYLKPDVSLLQIPTAFLYLGCWFLMAGVVYYFFGLETRGKTNEQIDRELGVAHA